MRIDLKGKPLLLYQIETLSKFDEDIFLVANSEEQIFLFKKQMNFPKEVKFLTDNREYFPYPEIFTPLLGLYSGLEKLNNLGFSKAFILSGDSPLIKAEVIELLINKSKNYDCCIPRWNNGFLEPLFAIYPVTEAFHKAKENLINKQFSLNHLLSESWSINYISVENSIQPLDENLVSLVNINGPIDIEKLIKFY